MSDSHENTNSLTKKQSHKIHFFEKEVCVEDCKDLSKQAVVFFGRERNLGFRVVLKQYKGEAN